METILHLHLRAQALGADDHNRSAWIEQKKDLALPAGEVAILLCDMWDSHWSRGAVERVVEMVPRMNAVVAAARDKGAHIIHAPSETLDFYRDSPARQRVLDLPQVKPPRNRRVLDPRLPIDDSDGGSDTGEKPWHKAWTRQHPAIIIDEERDMVSDDGREIYSCLRACGTRFLVVMGVHTNMCVLNRSFGIKQMVRWGVPVALVRDLTDTMYNPAMPPYVSHAEGTRLVVEYIEKFWCPTILSADL